VAWNRRTAEASDAAILNLEVLVRDVLAAHVEEMVNEWAETNTYLAFVPREPSDLRMCPTGVSSGLVVPSVPSQAWGSMR